MRALLLAVAAALLIGCSEEPAVEAPAAPSASEVATPNAAPTPVTEPEAPIPPRSSGTVLVEAKPPAPRQLPPSAAGAPREAMRYQRDLTANARAVWGLTAPVATFAGQVHQESTWKADARSRTGAAGLAQFMPRTADWISGVYADELGDNNPLNPAWALRALARYDKHLYDRISRYETSCDRMLFALSDYNGGAGWRIKRQNASPRPGSFEVSGHINPGITAGNQRENEEYPVRITRRWQLLYTSWGPGSC